MKVILLKQALEDLAMLVRDEPKAASRAIALIEECCRDPFRGTGKPEPLKHDRTGYWSRRITADNRLVYRVVGEAVEVVHCRLHY